MLKCQEWVVGMPLFLTAEFWGYQRERRSVNREHWFGKRKEKDITLAKDYLDSCVKDLEKMKDEL